MTTKPAFVVVKIKPSPRQLELPLGPPPALWFWSV
jgi:hypothetical protein